MVPLFLWAGCTGTSPADTDAPAGEDTAPVSRDSGLVTLWWVGDAEVGEESFSGTSWWTATAWPSERARCVWQQDWTSATPATGCEACTYAFELVLDAPTSYDGDHCASGDTLVYSTGSFDLAEIVAASTWREGLGVSPTPTNLLYTRYGYGDGDLWYAYGGTWYVAYWAYAALEDSQVRWGEYWGRGYYYGG